MDEAALLKELHFTATRSSGSGGQHVNKVSSKVELQFNIHASQIFSEEQKQQLLSELQSKLTKDKVLILRCDQTRSQHKNKEIVIDRFFSLLAEALKVEPERKPTKVPKHIKIKRLKQKRQHAEKKSSRKPPKME
ncbi:MAG TPA: alternative ribosome rescue aminoacyl-tRNA hydrolase ArfB [Flavobacteriaceae bacterium]|nr:alternative ribosome rescue aminoacyl-tRNA hydrolase ArfB [Flavobacteriaceae bacterium]